MASPNGPMEIVFSFDTTGSMSDVIDEVRGRVSDMIQRLQADIPGIKMAIFAHGDYCDRKSDYVTKYIDFTDNIAELVDFVKNVEDTWGGNDGGECYELVMHEVRTKLSWTPGSQRALVLIGDDIAHKPTFRQNVLKLDWRKEADSLASIGVRIYSVQCEDYDKIYDQFYADIARRTDGQHLKLQDFKNIFDFLMTVCYKEKGDDHFQNYEKEVRGRGGEVHKDLDKLFCDLRSKASATSASTSTVGASKPNTTSSKLVKLKKASPIKKKPSLTNKPVQKKLPVKKGNLTKRQMIRIPLKKMPVYTKPAILTSTKFEEKNLPKLRRENVPESNFLLREMPWSAWKLVISPSEKKGLGVTHARAGGNGFKTKSIFAGKTQVPALYEVAVQTKYRSRRHVVYSKLCRRGFANHANWEQSLFGRCDIQAQINDVLKKDCNVFIRRVVLKSTKKHEHASKNLSRYDYAWKGLKSVRVGHRQVTKASVEISNEMEM